MMSVELDQPPARAPVGALVNSRARLQLLGGFRLGLGDRSLELSSGTSRLLAFLAIQARPVERTYAANCLWMDKPELRAQANLRSCLWRLRQASVKVVQVSASHVWLAESVDVDLYELHSVSRDLMLGSDVDVNAIEPEMFCSELLPTWYDDFVELEREHLRQLRLHALEQIAVQFRRLGHSYRALSLALTAVGCDPLRESAHRLVMAIHLDEGNVSEALRQYGLLSSILRRDLGISPSAAATTMVQPWLHHGRELPAADSFRGDFGPSSV